MNFRQQGGTFEQCSFARGYGRRGRTGIPLRVSAALFGLSYVPIRGIYGTGSRKFLIQNAKSFSTLDLIGTGMDVTNRGGELRP